ncbi:hypothetical protein NM962_06035 [Mycobacterium sp. SVM_VP21]|nr:hypothetical protein NM962_06035 [Mycobacterium sp. SVM_VP21]
MPTPVVHYLSLRPLSRRLLTPRTDYLLAQRQIESLRQAGVADQASSRGRPQLLVARQGGPANASSSGDGRV